MGEGFITRFSLFSISLISEDSSTISSELLSSVLSMRLSMVNPAFLRGFWLGVGVVAVHEGGVVDWGGGCGGWGVCTLFANRFAKKSMGRIG